MQPLLSRYRSLHDGIGTYLYKGASALPDENLWNGVCFQRKLLKLFDRVVSKRQSFRVLDYGCGKARYLSEVHKRFAGRVQEWYCYDPGFNRYAAKPSGTFDIIICADVMEHVEDVELTLSNIAGYLELGGIAMFSISGRPDSRQFDDGLNMHVSLKSFIEWQHLIKDAFKNKKAILLYNNKHYWESWNASL